MCPRDSSQAQIPSAVQRITDLQEKFEILRAEMIAMEKERKEEAKEFEETLTTVIRKIVLAIRKEKVKESV